MTPTPYTPIVGVWLNEVAPGYEDANGNGITERQEDQCIELFNETGGAEDPAGWTLYNNDRLLHTYQTTLFADGEELAVFGVRWAPWIIQPGTLTLNDANGTEIDSIAITAANLLSVYARQTDGTFTAQDWPTCGFRNDFPTPESFTPVPTATAAVATYTPTATPTATRTVTPTRTATPRRGTATATPTRTPIP